MNNESLTLKWGSLKAWDFDESNTRALELLKKWESLGTHLSAAMHHDTDEQKQIICDLIDAGNFETVYLDWDGKEVSKSEAKEYVLSYGN